MRRRIAPVSMETPRNSSFEQRVGALLQPAWKPNETLDLLMIRVTDSKLSMIRITATQRATLAVGGSFAYLLIGAMTH